MRTRRDQQGVADVAVAGDYPVEAGDREDAQDMRIGND
jgi:hypothetical protein